MQKIFNDFKFEIASNQIGVDTTTITAPEGLTFFYFNPRGSNTAELVNSEILSQSLRNGPSLISSGTTQLTVAGDYTLENWPYILLTKEQAAEVTAAVDAQFEAQRNLAEARSAAKNCLHKFMY